MAPVRSTAEKPTLIASIIARKIGIMSDRQPVNPVTSPGHIRKPVASVELRSLQNSEMCQDHVHPPK